MSHMVIYRGSDGKPGYHQTDDIHDAVGFVEQMRNDQGVEHARIFRLEEVVFQYKPYYRVELAESGFGELALGSDGAGDNGTTHGTGNGSAGASAGFSSEASGNAPGNGDAESVNGSTTGELLISANGGAETTAGSNGGADDPSSTTTGSSTATATATDDGSGAKRGLFGR